jgi:hypothetical protein
MKQGDTLYFELIIITIDERYQISNAYIILPCKNKNSVHQLVNLNMIKMLIKPLIYTHFVCVKIRFHSVSVTFFGNGTIYGYLFENYNVIKNRNIIHDKLLTASSTRKIVTSHFEGA